MKRCPITYEIISDNENYSQRGLKLLAPQLKTLAPLAYSAEEQRQEAIARVGKMSIQGVQAKLSARLKVKEGHFEIVDQYGQYILKPQSALYGELPENEALTMSLAEKIGLDVPVHGLVYSKDNKMTYFIKRFDRLSHQQKLAVEDFAQLLQLSRDTKYDSTMESVASVVTTFCSFPKVEAVKLLKLTLFNFLIGNEDMHLKNFSLITRDQKIMLSPVYDLLNTTIALTKPEEELALLLNGKRKNLKRRDFIDYFAMQRLGLNENTITTALQELQAALPGWKELINDSFMSSAMREKYLHLLNERISKLKL
jgi:serine/threonine-protein kinase HipA